MIFSPSRQPRHGTAVASTPLRGEALNEVWRHTRPDDDPWTLAQLKEKSGSMCTTIGLRIEWKHGSVHVWYGSQHEQFSVSDLYKEVAAYRRGQQQLAFGFEEV